MLKQCKKCKEIKDIDDFYRRKEGKDGYEGQCKSCRLALKKTPHARKVACAAAKKYAERHPEKIKEHLKKWRDNNKQHRIDYSIKYTEDNPWTAHLGRARYRCNNPKCDKYKYYGAKGIKCLITKEEIKELWFRDKAYEMKKPSIDRIDNDGNYTFDNCQFIELVDNISKAASCPVLQYDLDGKFIKEWASQKEAENNISSHPSHISSVCIGERNQSGGFKWRYKNV